MIKQATVEGQNAVKAVTGASVASADNTLKNKQLEDKKVENQAKVTQLKEAAAKRLAMKKRSAQVTIKL